MARTVDDVHRQALCANAGGGEHQDHEYSEIAIGHGIQPSKRNTKSILRWNTDS